MSKVHDKTRRDRLRNQGCCINCGEPAGEYVRCLPCRKYHNGKVKDLRVYRLANGLCRECGVPAVPGETRCLLHKIENAEACAHARYKREVIAHGGVLKVQRGRCDERRTMRQV